MRRLFHLSLPVADLDDAARFYVDTLGARIGRRTPDWLYVLLWGHQITLQLRPAEVLLPDAQGKRHFGAVLPWVEWEALAERLAATDTPFLVPPTVLHEATPEEQANASPTVAAALARFKRPPPCELFDLEKDPHEWTNLADDPQLADVRDRLERALTKFRTETRDPFLDQQNVKAFQASQLAARDLAYRRQKNFAWPYLESFAKWRAWDGS